jgi:hypothetical protein
VRARNAPLDFREGLGPEVESSRHMAVDRRGTAWKGWTNKMGHELAEGVCHSATKVVVDVAA